MTGAPDLCKAGLWDIQPDATCPVCGALPDTECGGIALAEATKIVSFGEQFGALTAAYVGADFWAPQVVNNLHRAGYVIVKINR